MIILIHDADLLSDALAKKLGTRVWFKTNCKQGPDVLSYNVIGEIRGSEFPDEILTVGGHLDSWDLGEGAHDDGTGCMQSIEVIRAFKARGIRPKRTIRAVMFMNEENGLRGGMAYADSAKADGKKYLFAMESDSGGFTPREFSLTGSAAQLEKLNGWHHLLKPYGIAEITPGGGGADIGPLRKLGTATCGYEPDSQRYFDVHHASIDVFESVSRRELHLGAVVMTQLMYLISEYGL
jgi:carboxypeptidase Q